jgi:transcriptional regulator with XRE-family HTH domain
MIDNEKMGSRIAVLRKAKNLTGERFAELLHVTPQAVSKWENGKSLPETYLLPGIAGILGTTIDSLLLPQELVVLEAVLTDGETQVDVTRILNSNINGNAIYISANAKTMGFVKDSERVKILAVTYRTPKGTFHDYVTEDGFLSLSLKGGKYKKDENRQIIGAFYGNREDYRDCMVKIKHYDYFAWKEIPVGHESFPSSTKTEKQEYLTLIYSNGEGIHVVSCREGEALCYSKDGKDLYRKDTSCAELAGIAPLEWEKGMDCTWAGALTRAFQYMGESYTYEQLMGLSGACYRIAFTEVWDYSAVDALVAYDYSTPLFKATGFEQIWADRLSKEERTAERDRIVADINEGKPVIAINLRIAPEWGVITGYRDNGKILLCRTYFDGELLKERGMDYLEADFWPFLITHIGERKDKPSEYESLLSSLELLIKSFQAPVQNGYYQGQEAYERWIEGLLREELWDGHSSYQEIDRRIGVNDTTLLNLIDARRSAGVYLNEAAAFVPETFQEALRLLSTKYADIAESLTTFRDQSKKAAADKVHYNEIDTGRNFSKDFRKKQAELLKQVLEIEREMAAAGEELLQALKV